MEANVTDAHSAGRWLLLNAANYFLRHAGMLVAHHLRIPASVQLPGFLLLLREHAMQAAIVIALAHGPHWACEVGALSSSAKQTAVSVTHNRISFPPTFRLQMVHRRQLPNLLAKRAARTASRSVRFIYYRQLCRLALLR